MPDINVAKNLTARKSQFNVLQREIPKTKLDITCVNKAIICFGSKMVLNSISIVQVSIPIGTIKFYVVNIPTLFLLCLKEIDTLGIYKQYYQSAYLPKREKHPNHLQIKTSLVLCQ